MSMLRPKDGDYIVRGLFLLMGWWIFGTPLLIFGIALATGNANVGVLGFPISLVAGIIGYSAFLKFGEREYDREMSRRLELMIEERRIRIEMQRRGYKW